jgi:GNAT superfamily N-acetyltransferase
MVDFAVESLARARNSKEAARLLALQWNETGDSEVEQRPNWPMYEKLDAMGALLLVVARRDGKPVGFMLGTVHPHLNATQELVCTIPTYFVEEGPTRALILSRMLDFALEHLAARGVFKVDVETTYERSAGRLWELKGFKPRKIGYSLKLKALPEVHYA